LRRRDWNGIIALTSSVTNLDGIARGFSFRDRTRELDDKLVWTMFSIHFGLRMQVTFVVTPLR
jgi:hypothetical protein